MKRYSPFCIALSLAASLAFSLAVPAGAHEHENAAKIKGEHVLTVPLPGDPTKEIDINIYTFPPQTAVPWHIHPGALGIEHGLEGTVMLEEEGKEPFAIEKGKTLMVQPDVVHRGWNPSKTEDAKLYVIRIKPKGAPRATPVENVDSAVDVPTPSTHPDNAGSAPSSSKAQ